MRVLIILSLASLLAAPAALAGGPEAQDGIYPCEGGYYVDLGWLVTECLPGLGFTGTKPCAGPYGDGTSFWVDGKELFCLY